MDKYFALCLFPGKFPTQMQMHLSIFLNVVGLSLAVWPIHNQTNNQPKNNLESWTVIPVLVCCDYYKVWLLFLHASAIAAALCASSSLVLGIFHSTLHRRQNLNEIYSID